MSKREVETHAGNNRIQRTNYGSATVHVSDSLKSANGRGTSKLQPAVSKSPQSTSQTRSTFLQAQKEDVKKTASDLAEVANIVQGFDNHRSTVVPWLRETGILKHIAQLKKDEIKAAIALPSLDGEGELREIVDAMESSLREAHSLCFDGTGCMLTWPCRVVLSRFQSSQVDIVGKARAFDPYKEPGILKSYFGIPQRFLSYFHRVMFPDEYYFDIRNADEQADRPEDVVTATDEQLATWNDIWQTAKQTHKCTCSTHVSAAVCYSYVYVSFAPLEVVSSYKYSPTYSIHCTV